MKIISTAVLLGATLLAIPIITYYFGTALGDLEWKAIHTLMWIALGFIAYCFIVGELTHNNSQVDKLWSIIPVIYVWIVAWYGDFSPRLVVMAVLVTLWGIRLTTNFAMKGPIIGNFGQVKKTIDGKYCGRNQSSIRDGNGPCLIFFLYVATKIRLFYFLHYLPSLHCKILAYQWV